MDVSIPKNPTQPIMNNYFVMESGGGGEIPFNLIMTSNIFLSPSLRTNQFS